MSEFSELLNKSRGYEAFNEKEKEVEERQKNTAYRFWLKPETEAKIIFLDDNPPIIEEHQSRINNSWLNWFTCKRAMMGEPCILCDIIKDRPYTVGFYTILDLSEYTNKKGETIKNTIKLFAPKFKALQLLKRHSQKLKSKGHENGLELAVFDVYRSSSDAFNVGDSFEFDSITDWDTVKSLNKDAAVIDYASLLQPKSDAEIKKLLKQNTEDNLDTNVYGAIDEDDVPF